MQTRFIEFKNFIEDKTSALVQDVEDGNETALETAITLKAIIDHTTKCFNQIKDVAINELQDEKVKEFYFGKIERKNAAGRYDFSNIPEWNETKERLKEIEEHYKKLHKASSSLWQQGKMIAVNEETGETPLLPIYKDGGETIAITLKK